MFKILSIECSTTKTQTDLCLQVQPFFFILSLLYVNVFVLDFPGLSTFFVSSEQYFPVKLHASLMVGEEVHIFRSSGDTLTAIIPYRELLLPLMCMCEDHLNVYFKSGPKNINYF